MRSSIAASPTVRPSQRAAAPAGEMPGVLGSLQDLLHEDPALATYEAEILMLARAALLAERVTSLLPGSPPDVTDIIDFPAPTAEEILADATLAGQVRHRILGAPMMTASAVSELLGSLSVNKRQYAHARRKSGELLALHHSGQYLFPAFQFDIEHGAIRPGVAQANLALGALEDPWGAASWWLHPHGALAPGQSPADLLESAEGLAVLRQLVDALAQPVG